MPSVKRIGWVAATLRGKKSDSNGYHLYNSIAKLQEQRAEGCQWHGAGGVHGYRTSQVLFVMLLITQFILSELIKL